MIPNELHGTTSQTALVRVTNRSKRRHGVRRVGLFVGAFGVAALLLAGCSEEAKQDARQTVTQVSRDATVKADETAARTQAEALRGAMKAGKGTNQSLRSMDLVKGSGRDLPGNVTVVGATDGDADGLDDDGLVEVRVDGSIACVVLPASGDDTTVRGGACAAGS